MSAISSALATEPRDPVEGLAELHAAAASLIADVSARPLVWLHWLPVQDRYWRSQAGARLFMAGNQSVGKSTGAVADLYLHATGQHPYRYCAKAGEYWLLCASWSQSIAPQNRLWEVVEKARLRPGTEFSAKTGFRGRDPSIEVQHVSGEWSIIRIRTTKQDTLDLSGASIDGALFDEVPKNARIYQEVIKRTQSTDGWVSIAMTAVNAPVDWIEADWKAGRIERIHTALTPEALIPIGRNRPLRTKRGRLKDAAWIEEIREKTPAHEAPVTLDGGWAFAMKDRYFSRYVSGRGDGSHVHTRIPSGQLRICLGLDYGSGPGKQIALLVCVLEPTGHGYPSVYVLDEYAALDGATLPEEDAEAVLGMLARHGMQWGSIDHAQGDRIHMPGTGSQKSNRDLMAEIGRRLRVPSQDLRPQIRTAKRGQGRGAGSVNAGSRWLYHAMVRPGGFGVHPRCVRLIKALDRYHPLSDNEWKDPIDALRYALDAYIFRRYRLAAPVSIRLY